MIPTHDPRIPFSRHSYGITPRTGFAAADGLHVQHYVTLPQFLRDGDGGALGRLVEAGGTTAPAGEQSRPAP